MKIPPAFDSPGSPWPAAGPSGPEGQSAANESNLPSTVILDGLVQATLLVDAACRIVSSNETAKMLLMPKGRLIGRKLETVLADRQLSQLVMESFDTGRKGSLSCAMRLPGEAWREDRHFIVEAHPAQSPAEKPLVRLTLRPDPAAEAAAQAAPNRVTDVLLQLRGPLTIVQGYLENLLDGMITDPVALRQSLLTMRRSTTQIERILETLRQ